MILQEALQAIAGARHELALHAWRGRAVGAAGAGGGEPSCSAGKRKHWSRSDTAHMGVARRAGSSARTAELLKAHGYRYTSPAGDRVTDLDGLKLLPFRWELVDAYFHFPRLGGLRGQLTGDREGDPPPLPPAARAALFHGAIRIGSIAGARRMRRRFLEAVTEPRGHQVLILHPFLLRWKRTMDAMTDVLEQAVRQSKAGALRVVPMHELA